MESDTDKIERIIHETYVDCIWGDWEDEALRKQFLRRAARLQLAVRCRTFVWDALEKRNA